MLVLSPTRPLGLGKSIHNHGANTHMLRPISTNRRCAQLVPRATEVHQLESLMAATTMALLVQMSPIPIPDGWGTTVQSVHAAQVMSTTTGSTTDATPPGTAPSRRPPATTAPSDPSPGLMSTTTEAGRPSPPALATTPTPTTGGFFSLLFSPRTPQSSSNTPPVGVSSDAASAATGTGPAGPAARFSAVRSVVVPGSRVPQANITRDVLEVAAREEADQPEEGKGAEDLRSLARWGLERAALITLGGVAGVALVRTLSSPAARAVNLDAVTAAAATAATTTKNISTPSSSSSSAPPAPPQPTSPPQGPRGHAAQPPAGQPALAQQPLAYEMSREHGSGGWQSGVAVTPPPPAGGPFYGAQPPPWWGGQYGAYERYGGGYDGTAYGPPPPPSSFRGYAWDEQHQDTDSGPAAPPAAGPPDPYYPPYYTGVSPLPPPPPGYWQAQDPRRRVPYPTSDMYHTAYGLYDGPLLPPPSAARSPPAGRGFVGTMRDVGGQLGRNPWAAVESEDRQEEQAVPPYIDRRTAMHPGLTSASPSPGSVAAPSAGRDDRATRDFLATSSSVTSAKPEGLSPLSHLRNLDDELANLQLQIQQLQAGGVPLSAAQVAAAAASVTTEHATDGRPPQVRNDSPLYGTISQRSAPRDWRRQLQQQEQNEERKQQSPVLGVVATAAGEGNMQQQGADGDVGGVRSLRERAGMGPGVGGAEAAGGSVAVRVSPSADTEYLRLMQLWREAHADEAPQPEEGQRKAEEGQEGGQEEEEGETAINASPGVAASAAAAAAPVSESAGAQQQGTTRVAVVGGGSGGGAADGTGSGGGGGPLGWFSRMFGGLGGGGKVAAQQSANPPSAAYHQEGQSVGPVSPEGPKLAVRSLTREEEATGAVSQQEKREEQHTQDNDDDDNDAESELPGLQLRGQEPAVPEAQHQQQHHTEAVAQQMNEEATSGAAAVVVSPHGVPHPNWTTQPLASGLAATPNEPTTTTTVAIAHSIPSSCVQNAATAAPPPPPPAAAAAIPTTPAVGLLVPSPRPPSTSNDDSLQRLKATSAAAADRAAETLARIRAIRAEAAAGAGAAAMGPRAGQANKAPTNGARPVVVSNSGGASTRSSNDSN